jgi:hypothetical protein
MGEGTATFEGWAVIELMGHRKLAGMVREVTIAGAGFLRLDVPGEGDKGTTQFYPPTSVYCLTPTTEEIARAVARNQQPAPVQRYELRALPARDAELVDHDDGNNDPDEYGY